ncbi:23S rRNA (uracil1939-C5)-methyltransferase [Syntrophus gentianae]|uniref:23S rRNA (Uracil1939-C5)-methyltransferase n=1 Tax=Syntrophus gentianae TaxID=43775 RepID=A0A1H7YCP9_9BACT|nr:23S rRNA (uracil(1939)-C(5))-methyltransferase RlmD [Syntrophus gentianae]SEM43743.1 23S rRNA (uracil1939-C5)-methyltransferase [Syntrophus gentianae]
MEKRIEIGDRLEVTMDSVAFGGSGVGRHGRLVLFVPFAVDGDTVEIEIDGIRRSYATGRICRILNPSPFRTEAKCPHYERCGGCQYQHIAYAHQLELKKRQVGEALARIGKVPDPPVREVLPSPMPYAYRGKAEFHLRFAPGKSALIGYKEAADSRIVPVSRCEIVDESINRSLDMLRKKLEGPSPSNRRGGKGEERVVLWSEAGAASVEPGHSPVRGNRVLRQVKGKILRVPAWGFFQANSSLVETMVDTVVRACALSGAENLLDAYCGSGLFSLFLAPRVQRLFGVDGDREAIGCAEENLREEGVSNGEFYAGDVGEILKKHFLERKTPVDVVVLDPPRIGCSADVLDGLLRLKPSRIVYISCNPTTQARDMRRLLDGGYTLKELQPLDMFPQTKHIEVAGILER